MFLFLFVISLAFVFVENGNSTQVNEIINNYSLECMVRQFNFTPTITDANGKKCRGLISTKSCFGSCETYEYGTDEYPHIISENPSCNYNETRLLTAVLTNCDPGVQASATVYRYIEALSCICKKCNPQVHNCRTIPNVRSQGIPVTEGSDLGSNNVPTRRTKRTGHRRLIDTNQVNSW